MAVERPVAELHTGFSSPGATASDWAEGRRHIDAAEVFWLSTVRPDGRPHVTPLLAVWRDDAMYFCTGPDERKAKNLRQNQHCILTTGQNGLDGLDVVVEGDAVEVSDGAELALVANTYESKYGAHFTAPEGTWYGLGDAMRAGKVLVYRVAPATILGFAKGEQFSQTRWRFG
ncbi:MAG: pyridoxamine 5'-phosphate oxidase family protein [Solirubrobacteraceae bacterium]|jgi:nitroimidazol reductase NimA-like FMN-containing flavoprotein (pyridoxamine 5'-phosphate oxidase superfamily)